MFKEKNNNACILFHINVYKYQGFALVLYLYLCCLMLKILVPNDINMIIYLYMIVSNI